MSDFSLCFEVENYLSNRMGHAGFVVFVETGLWLAVKWAVQIFAPLHLDQMDSSVLECLASHKSREREMMSLTCQEREKKMCELLHLPQNVWCWKTPLIEK